MQPSRVHCLEYIQCAFRDKLLLMLGGRGALKFEIMVSLKQACNQLTWFRLDEMYNLNYLDYNVKKCTINLYRVRG